MANLKLSVVVPDGAIIETEAASIVAPGVNGYLGIMPGHIPVIIALRTGLFEFRDARQERRTIALSGGFMEVSNDSVNVIADTADLAEEIDLKEAEMQLEEARKALRGENSNLTTEQATTELERAMNRIKAARSR